MKLNARKWKPFKIEDIFGIKPGKRLEKEKFEIGQRPFIGSTDKENGVTAFVSNNNNSLDKNVLGVNYNGSVALSFYHPYECLFSDDVKRFHLKNYPDDKYVCLFFKVLIQQQKCVYSYGYKFNEKRMKHQTILVPVDGNGNPDYQFMHDYMHSLEQDQLSRYRNYCRNMLSALKYKKIPMLNQKQWKDFKISEIFGDCKNTSAYHTKNIQIVEFPGIPYITRTNLQNGFEAFVKSTGDLETNPSNHISFGAENATFFFQPYEYINGNKMYYCGRKFDKYTSLFLVCCLNKSLFGTSYGFGLGLTGTRANSRRFMLPIDDDSKPDFEFMKQYTINWIRKKIETFLCHIRAR